ncbi:hypothetical protein AcW1_004575 [Taiwanofungus camphoratus]|nr:hypothetical protein AcV5_000960 [Antrodia cinnamomea]KAI0959880.1 hypothetical protein AcW1_004575 [Antrodia cinnamomea]
MSLLKYLAPRLRATRRPCLMGFLSTAPPTPADVEASVDLFETLSSPTPSASSSTVDDGPPAPPEGAYPPPQNPMKESRQKSQIVEAKPIYTVHVKATKTNSIITFAGPGGNPIQTLTGGNVGFKGTNRSGYEAGYKCAVGVFKTLKKEMERVDLNWELFLNGFGQAREAVHKALMAGEGQEVKSALVRITDKTPIKVGGTRAQKKKRR